MRKPTGKTARMIKAFTVILTDTTWKCGKVERLVVNYLRKHCRGGRRARIPVREMLQHFRLTGKRKSEFLNAIKRLEKRRIIKIEGL